MKPAQRLTLWFLLPLLAGCSLHRPQEATLPAPLPAAFAEEADPATPTERWWEAFVDPRLNSLVEEAFAANRDLEQACVITSYSIHYTKLYDEFDI